MSKYLRMWEKVKLMSHEERKAKLAEIEPTRGKIVDLDGVGYFDVDLAEALWFMVETE